MLSESLQPAYESDAKSTPIVRMISPQQVSGHGGDRSAFFAVTDTTTAGTSLMWAPHPVQSGLSLRTYTDGAPRALRMLSTYHLNRVEYGGKLVDFDKGLSLEVNVSYEDGKYIAYDEKFGLYGFGDSAADARSDFEEFFVNFFKEIAESNDDELPASTLEFKRTLLTFGTLRNRE